METYRRLSFLVPAEHEEIFVAELWARGLLGCELQEATAQESAAAEKSAAGVRIIAYFPDPLPQGIAAWDTAAWSDPGVVRESSEQVAAQDDLAVYRAAAQPIILGRGFLVLENDPDDPGYTDALAAAKRRADDDERQLLRIPARTAFGTGSHETTRLVVDWLEDLSLSGGLHGAPGLEDATVLDVGTGSGILAFVARHLGARRVVGFDADAQSVVQARANAALNDGMTGLAFYAGRLAAVGAAVFDIALVNVLPERILDDLPLLLSRGTQFLPLLAAGGIVVSSGNLHSRRDELVQRYASLGLACRGEKVCGDWIAFLLVKDKG